MPIEIRELVIQAQKEGSNSSEDQSDEKSLYSAEEVDAKMRAYKKEIMEECLIEVAKLLKKQNQR